MTASQVREPTPPPLGAPSSDEDDGDAGLYTRKVGLLLGIVLFTLFRLLPAPSGLPEEGWTTAAVAVLMACWWMTEAVPITVTALLPLVLLPALGVATMPEAASPYANEVIFLFMGGFFLAAAMERWEVHRRMALVIMGAVGTSPRQLLFGIMAATGFISMWISNTATAAMMLPIALAVGTMCRREDHPPGKPYNFGMALMLGMAYASSIGGVGTLVGTPPNALFAAAAQELAGIQIGFAQWMMVGIPLAWTLLPLTWLILIKVYPPDDARGDAAELLAAERQRQGPMTGGEKFVTAVFLGTAFAWILREPKELGAVTIPGLATWLPGLTDSSIAIAASVILMAVPLSWKRMTPALEWKFAARIPWGVLVLFGGALSLASAMSSSGFAEWIGEGIQSLAGVPLLVLLLAICALFVFSGELTSNTAVTALAMPMMAGVALTLGYPPVTLMATAALACSMGFMLPAGTPPNAIVFSSGYLTIGSMVRAGILVNLVSIVLIALIGTFLVPLVFGP